MCQRGNGLIRNVNLRFRREEAEKPHSKSNGKGSEGTLESRVQTKRRLCTGQRPCSATAKPGDFSREQ